MTADAPENLVAVSCRFDQSGCVYGASGPESFVRCNYKQHLRESHAVNHPRIEDAELRLLTPAEIAQDEIDAAQARARRNRSERS